MTSDFDAKSWMDQFQKLWNPMGIAVPGIGQPTIDPKELEKKINELKVVQSWLKTNTGMVDMTIKTLEMQKAALESMHAAAASKKKSGKTSK